MNEADLTGPRHEADEELFLVELPAGEGTRYAICERIVMVDPDSSRDLPWNELAALFRGKTLRAVRMPGKTTSSVRLRNLEGGASTRAGVATAVEVNLIKIERKD
ncbi:hypothetical protein [uncultured Sphingomonas sp.]|uniref:hypothetical protein n=1 Tax=uncultured Sphingomonas sp. TaxID=158754 RepID=UPI0035CC4CB1